jgi:hypothetical protein
MRAPDAHAAAASAIMVARTIISSCTQLASCRRPPRRLLHFRVLENAAAKAKRRLTLRCPPAKPGETPWFEEDWTDPRKVRDRLLFA